MALFIGLMTGTSVDAIDVAVVDMLDSPRLVLGHVHAMDEAMRHELLAVASQNDLAATLSLDARLGEVFAEAVMSALVIADLRSSDIVAIGSHGQTILHSPDSHPAFTCQIGDPNIIAARTGIDTVADFRRRDIAEGGQGAPLAPAFHAAVFRSPTHSRAILNIGGIANITLLDSDPDIPVLGFDTGPGNGLMDAWSKYHRDAPMDEGGQWASEGELDPGLLANLLSDPYFSRAVPKSTGKERFNLRWILKRLEDADETQPANVQRTLLELTARTIVDHLQRHASACDELWVCGGGVHNRVLLSRIASLATGLEVRSSAELGVDPDFVEAMAFAWLAQQTIAGRAGNLPSVTGAGRHAPLGAVYKA